MVNEKHIVFKANDRSYFAILKKEIHAIADSANFSPKKIAEIDIIIAEVVSNLVKHAGGGQVLIKLVKENDIQGIEIISIDNGPGMQDVTRMVADGVSTKNTLGQGLGAMKRLSDLFQVFSLKDWGTIILIRVFNEEKPLFIQPPKYDIKSLVLPKPGEEECGDGFYYSVTSDYIKLFLGDGLGHGPEAAKAVAKAGAAFEICNDNDPVDIIRFINENVKRTRGLVGTVAVFDIKLKKWRICGIGNITTRVSSLINSKSYLAYNGIIGLNVPNTLNAQEIQHEHGQQLLMFSDGLKSRVETSKYPLISRYDLSILCASIYKDFARNTDDMSIAACKLNF